jgi:hypothetical protein
VTGSHPPGALEHIAAVVTRVADRAGGAADRADALADQVRGDARALMHALGGGPPAQLREADVRAESSGAALAAAAAALREAAAALQAYAARLR